MGLTDEIWRDIETYADVRASSLLPETVAGWRDRLRSRLSALEQELEGYRRNAVTVHALGPVEVTDPAMWAAAYREAEGLPCTSEYVNAQSGYDAEDGG